jgi:DNA-binding beta-propeller fold protein YncE
VLKDVRALATVPGGAVWIASAKTRSAVTVDGTGRPTASLSAEDPRALSVGPNGEVVLAASTAVRVGPSDVRSLTTPPDKPGGDPKPLEKVLAAALTRGGSLLVSDEDREKVLRFDAKGQLLGTFPPQDAARRKVTRLLVDGEGAIVWLDREEKAVRVWDEAGQPIRAIGPAGLKKPVDVAVDPFRNLYVADEELGVLVFDPQGRPLATLAGAELRRPKALALDATGAVLVYDDKVERVLRYR